ncbi:MAG: ribose-phosphate diphosphokinase [Eubacteriales bacterium]|nr:ribose-phosphate diphosphokinase [Eubacteriales bacterium]
MSQQGPNLAAGASSTAHLHEKIIKPIGPLAVISHQMPLEISDKINSELTARRALAVENQAQLVEERGFLRRDYRTEVDLSRFSSGEGQATLIDSVRGHDVFIISDVLNHGAYMSRMRKFVSLSPDDHYQDLLRIITATHGITRRINVVMPYLYAGRRYRRVNRGSMDCAMMLKELFSYGVSNFITFDAHDARVANAVPRNNFETFPTSYHMVKTLLDNYPDLQLDPEHFMVVAPDENTINRCVYYASILKVPLGIFYRKRTKVRTLATTAEKAQKEFLGENVKGKDVLIVDDMLDSGQTVMDCVIQLKDRGARRIFIAVSFAHFSRGWQLFDGAKDEGVIEKIFVSNLSYLPIEVREKSWFMEIDLSDYVAKIIDLVNFNQSLQKAIDPSRFIEARLAEHYKAQGKV